MNEGSLGGQEEKKDKKGRIEKGGSVSAKNKDATTTKE